MIVVTELSRIQRGLKAPKGQRNDFGKYNYRSCEDILEAIKPLLNDDQVVTLSDDIVEVGGRVYVKATATFWHGKESLYNSAYARESLTRKGMDDSQITGSASSYARKYALNGLFMIDDTKDADTVERAQGAAVEAQEAHNAAVGENLDSITAIKQGIAEGDLSTAAEAWFELGEETKHALWVAPSKGGKFTTEERNIMKSKEFRLAYYGVEDE